MSFPGSVSPPHVLLIADRGITLTPVVRHLTASGCRLTIAESRAAPLDLIDIRSVDFVLLGLAPRSNAGIDLCRSLRNSSDVPIVAIARSARETDCVAALESGADDFLAGPISMAEFDARVRAVLRRARRRSSPTADADWFTIGRISLELRGREVRRDGTPVPFKAKEFDLLTHMIAHEGQTLTRRQLLEGVWGRDCYSSVRTVDVHVSCLREKLEPNRRDPRYLITVLGTGYRLQGVIRGASVAASSRVAFRYSLAAKNRGQRS